MFQWALRSGCLWGPRAFRMYRNDYPLSTPDSERGAPVLLVKAMRVPREQDSIRGRVRRQGRRQGAHRVAPQLVRHRSKLCRGPRAGARQSRCGRAATPTSAHTVSMEARGRVFRVVGTHLAVAISPHGDEPPGDGASVARGGAAVGIAGLRGGRLPLLCRLSAKPHFHSSFLSLRLSLNDGI